MNRAPSFCGVVLATGAPMRDGREKALLPAQSASLPNLTLLGAHIELLKRHTDLVVVVAGKNAAALGPVVYAQAGFITVNSAPELGEFSSLKLGLREVLNRGRDAAFVATTDRLPVSQAAVARLHGSFLEAINKGLWAAVPEFEGHAGSPYVIGREMIEALLRSPLTMGASDVFSANAEHVSRVLVDDPRVTGVFDSADDLARLVQFTQETAR